MFVLIDKNTRKKLFESSDDLVYLTPNHILVNKDGNKCIQADMVEVVEVNSIPEECYECCYYSNGKLVNYDPIEYESKQKEYKEHIKALIRERYSADDELAIIRKKVAGTDTKKEFEDYHAYAEQCKTKAKDKL